MPRSISAIIRLTIAQQKELEKTRDQDQRPHMREKAAAILKMAAGESGRHVALCSLLRPRKPETVCGWWWIYQAQGLSGLEIKPGRGRKPVRDLRNSSMFSTLLRL